MKTVQKIGCLMLLLLTASLVFAQKTSKVYADGEVLVKFRNAPTAELVKTVNDELQAELVETLGDLGWVRVRLPEGLSVENAMTEYQKFGEVEAVQPNFYYQLAATPNDPQFTTMYGLTKISAPTAWDMTTGSSTVVVANIDTGNRYTHEDLTANSWTNPGEINNNGVDDDGNGFIDDYYGYDFRFNDSNPIDENGHGTHTAGTIGAAGNNSLGVTGVNWNVKIMAIKIYSAGATDSTSAMLVNAYNYIRLMKERGINIRATNNSYGDCPEACGYDQATRDALEALGNAGVLNVFAAGNNARNVDTGAPHFPSSYTLPTILSVASSTSTDARSSFSNWGTTSVDLAAPGSSILSTTNGSNTSYGSLSGTSMATPHVTGAVALLAAQHPSLSAVSLKATLMNTVDVLPAWNGVVKTGGRLNVAAALQNPTVCSFNLAQSSMNVRYKGGTFSVNVTSAQNCDYTVKSNVGWISVIGSDTMSGNGTVTFRVATGRTVSRTGTLTIGGQILTVQQTKN